jgi:DNA-binding transcriptional ArsR family regulator
MRTEWARADVETGENAMRMHPRLENVAKHVPAACERSLAPSGARVASPAFGEAELRALARDINQSKDAAVIFATDPHAAVRQKALDILAEAERRTGLTTNAVTGFHEKSGSTVIVFRNPATATRAEVFEELRHLDWARAGNWNKDLPGVLTAFELRELDAAAHFCNLLREGKITPDEFDETIRNLAHHLSKPGKPVTEAQARSLLEGLTP